MAGPPQFKKHEDKIKQAGEKLRRIIQNAKSQTPARPQIRRRPK